jgi:hypothetical protein
MYMYLEIIYIFFYYRPAFCRGPHTLTVPAELFQENRKRLCESLKGKVGSGAIVLLQGGEAETRHCSDHEPIFRQVSYSGFSITCEKHLHNSIISLKTRGDFSAHKTSLTPSFVIVVPVPRQEIKFSAHVFVC